MQALRLATAWVLLALPMGCSKSEPQESTPQAPWRAQPAKAAASLPARFKAQERCQAAVELRAKEAKPRGTFRVCRGELEVDLLDLEKSKGKISIDVASIEMLEDGDGGRSDESTRQAQNWLDVGASRPEAERERLRWATFTLTAVEDLSSTSAHKGKVIKLETDASAVEDASPEEDAEATPSLQARAVTFTAKGYLVLHGVRVETSVPMRAVFHYARSAGADQVPARLTLESRRPLAISLRVHDIKPRDASGLFQARDMKLLGKVVGTEARVTLGLQLEQAAP